MKFTVSRAIIHVDMDAFYAAIEVLDAPALRGKPLIVAGLGRRGVVSTCSYEARRFGVHSAMPTAQARRLCPDGVYVEPRMARYVEVSREVFDVFNEFTPEIEGLSLDEAFLDVTASRALLGDLQTIGRHLKMKVQSRVGLPCSVGMAHNKLLAKLASELSKPDGLLHIDPERVGALLDPLPVGRLWTVGRVAAAKLEQAGVRTIGDLRNANLMHLKNQVGEHAATLQALARGEDERPVVADREDKSIGAETTFEYDLETIEQARTWLMRMCERVGERTRAHELAGRRVTVKLRVPPFETMTRQSTLSIATSSTSEIHAAALALLEKWWGERKKPRLRLLGVTLAQFDADAAQNDLFAPPAPKQDQLLDAINRKFGKGAIRRAKGL
jgi:DNA polymerase-4